MEIVSLSSTNYVGLTSRYSSDNQLLFNQNIYYTEEGLEIPLINVFSKLNDSAVNNYSNLFLSTQQPISGTIYIENLAPIVDNGFSTYLGTNALVGINENSRFLGVYEPEVDVNTAMTTFTGTYEFLDNSNMFDITFLDDKLCKISHEYENITRYLTVDYLGEIIFAKDSKSDYAGDLSPQIWYYMYDRVNNFILFLKNLNDIVKYLAYNPSTENLTLIDPLTSADVPYKNTAIFNTIPRVEIPNETRLYDPWLSYTHDYTTHSQNINTNKSILDVRSNLLVNSEYYNITGTDMPVNILSLKNTNTPENYQSRNNPFSIEKSIYFAEKSVEMRDYKKLFAGSNQKYGNDNISIGYEAYTTDIVLKKDSITYFHIPYDFYPYIQLNINDSGLVQAGAMPGDHPLKADKVFKKLAHYKYTSPFGESADETSGYFLCSWLSGSWDVNVKPIWMDRYYNPQNLSFVEALTTSPFQAIKYITVDDCDLSQVANILGQVDVFDKPSDLIFEPGSYYAYHHYGNNDVDKYVDSLELFKVQQNLDIYNDIYDKPVIPLNAVPDYYNFTGTQYGVTGSLSAIQDSGTFTVSFWAKTSDWNVPFGTQIIGNYANDGFGIFNQNVVTPTLYVNSASGAFVLNSNLEEIKRVDYGGEVGALVKYPTVSDYFVLYTNGHVARYNCSDAKVQAAGATNFKNIINYDYTDSTIYVLCSAAYDTNTITVIDTKSLIVSIYNVSSWLIKYPSSALVFANDIVAGWDIGNISQSILLDDSNTIDYYNGNLYFTPGQVTRRIDDTIYYLKDGNTIVRWDTIEKSTAVPVITAYKSATGIADFNIDYAGNLWIIDSINNYYQFTTDKQFILSGSLAYNPNFNNYKIGFTGNFNRGKYVQRTLIMQAGTILLTPDPNQTYNYNIIDDQTQSLIEGLVANTFAPVSASGLLFNYIDPESNSITQSNSFLAITGTHFDPTITSYLRKFVSPNYPESNFNVKTTMVNRFNPHETRTVDVVYSLTALDPGYHHFAARVDTYNGYLTLFVDGIRANTAQFEPRRFQFDNFSRRPFLVGTANFINSVPLFKYLKTPDDLVSDLQIKYFNIYNDALTDYDIAMLARQGMTMHDIHFNVPCGRRNYIEEIERYFKARIPGSKSSLFNLVIKNSGITDLTARAEFEAILLNKLSVLTPAYAKINTIKWIN